MDAHASDCGDSLNPRRGGGKRVTMVMMFVGKVVSVLDGISVLFPQLETYKAGGLRSHQKVFLTLTPTSILAGTKTPAQKDFG